MTLLTDPIARKELVLDKIIIGGLDMQGGDPVDGKGSFAAINHQHDYTQGFGAPERREGIWLLNDPVSASFNLPHQFRDTAWQMKLLAMMETWQNRKVDLAILLNGRLLRRGEMLFENVCAGWPANFLMLPADCLRAGKNTITFENHSPLGKRDAMFINQVEILIRPKDARFQFELAPSLVRINEPFQIRLRNTTGKRATCTIDGRFRLLAQKRDGQEDVFIFQCPIVDNAQSITFTAGAGGGKSLRYQPDQVAHADAPYELLVGTDFDDDRHDETTLETIDLFHKLELGNIIGFRPKLGRTCFVIPDQKLFCQWFDFIKSRDLYCWLEDAGKRMPWMTEKLIRNYPRLIAAKYHEICNEIAADAPGYRDLKDAHDKFYGLIAQRHQKMSLPGRPFWLSSGTAKTLLLTLSDLVDVPIAEPSVHDHIFLYSTVRKTAALHNKPWGAHVPITWYLGNAHSEDKLRRMQISLHAAHLMGAKLIYTESGLFKYVQYTRRDAEHPISQQTRATMRNFYRYTRTQQPRGTPLSSINILYGNLDSFFFYHDTSTIDGNRSHSRQLWYKWPFTDIDRGWMLARNLFRPLLSNEYKGYPGDTEQIRFSSNPFGSVDIIPLADLTKNPLPLTFLLGRNIMTAAVFRTLFDYVKNGGTLFLSVHHFNSNSRPDAPPVFSNDQLGKLCGFTLMQATTPLTAIKMMPNSVVSLPRVSYKVAPAGAAALSLFSIAREKSCTSLAIEATSGAPVLIANKVGKGTVLCYTGHTPLGNPRLKPFLDDLIQSLAKSVRPEIHIANDAAVYLQQYRFPYSAVTQIFLQNINWKSPLATEVAELSIGGKVFPIEVPPGAPRILYHTPAVTLGASSPLTQIYDLLAHPNALTFTAAGRDVEIFTVLATRLVKRVLFNNIQEVAVSADPRDRDILQFACPLHRPVTITVEH